MFNALTTLLFTATGAFVIWLTKGFKGPFDNEMVRIDEKHSARGIVRYFLGMGIWIAVVVIMSVALTRQTKTSETKAYKARVNEKGGLELEEIK